MTLLDKTKMSRIPKEEDLYCTFCGWEGLSTSCEIEQSGRYVCICGAIIKWIDQEVA